MTLGGRQHRDPRFLVRSDGVLELCVLGKMTRRFSGKDPQKNAYFFNDVPLNWRYC